MRTRPTIKELQTFRRLAYNKEDCDCSVRALAVACSVPYDIAHAAMHFAGRGPCQAATYHMIECAAYSLGFVMVKAHVQAKTMRTLCRELADHKAAFIALSSSHCAGFWLGECIDWSHDTLKRIEAVYIVAKRNET